MRIFRLLSMTLLLLGAPAPAGADPDPAAVTRVEDLQALVAEVRPQVEEILGRTFAESPRVELVSRDKLGTRLLSLNDLMRSEGVDLRASRGWYGSDAYVEDLLERSYALYFDYDSTLYFIQEALEDLAGDARYRDTFFRPVLRCMVAHELTHALQHRYAPPAPPSGSETWRNALMLREGHAQQVQREVCAGTEAQAFIEGHQGLDVLASHPPRDPAAWLYGYGARFVALIQEAGGMEAVWWALSQPPPPDDLVIAAVRPSLLPGWADPSVVSGPARGLAEGVGWSEYAGPASPVGVLDRIFPGVYEPDAFPAARAGQVYVAERPGALVFLAAFALEEPLTGSGWIGVRKGAARQPREQGGVGRGTRVREPELSGADRVLHLRNRRLPYEEWWVQEGALLVGAVRAGVRGPPGALEAAVERVRNQDLPVSLKTGPPRGGALPERVHAWMDRYRELEDHPPALSWHYHLQRAAEALRIEDWSTCLKRGRNALERSPAWARERVTEVIYACAVWGGDLSTAKEALGGVELAGGELDELALRHARLLAGAGRWTEGLGVLSQVRDPPPEVTNLALGLAIQAEDVDRAAALASDPDLDPHLRFAAAGLLVKARRFEAARALLRSVCPDLEGEPRARCQEALGVLE